MNTSMISLAVAPLIVWAGLFIYLLIVDRKLARIERAEEQNDL